MLGHPPVGRPGVALVPPPIGHGRRAWLHGEVIHEAHLSSPRFRVPEADRQPRPPKFVTIDGETFEVVWDGA